MFSETNKHKHILLIFILALLVRFTGLILFPDTNISTNAETAIIGGSELIRNGEFISNPNYPTLVPPLTALFTAAIQYVFDGSLLAVKIFQILLDAVTVILIFAIARSFLPYSAAILGSLAVSVYPFNAFTTLYIGTEMLFSFFLIAFTYVSIRAFQTNSLKLFLLSGLILGLSVMTRGTTLFFPLFMLLFILWYYKSLDITVINKGMMFIIGFILIMTPWSIRNIVVLDAFIPASTPGLPVLNGASEEFWVIKDRNREYPKYFEYLEESKGIQAPDNPSWVEKGNFYKQAAITKYRERWENEPLSYIPFLVKKFARLWYATETGNRHAFILIANLPIYLFALYGLWLLVNNNIRISFFPITILAYFVLIHTAVYTLFRFLVPVMPFIIIIAAYGFISLLDKLGISIIEKHTQPGTSSPGQAI